ncbi:MAG: TlpA disulfide reductase family protein [Pyrinomonadaceae bacterium]
MRNFLFAVFFSLLFSLAAFAQADGPVKLKGQVVCSSCWFEAKDRKKTRYGTPADIQCATDCSEQGLPQALAVEDENGFSLFVLEKGSYKATGKDFLKLVPKTVEIEGDLRTENDKRFIKVNSLKVVNEVFVKPTPKSETASLSLKDLAGTDQTLADHRGKVVVLNFWATWCVPCRKEMPYLAAIARDYAAKGVEVIGASGDAVANSAKVAKFVRDHKVDFPIWLGTSATDMKRFGVSKVLPSTVVIDQDGKIVWREIGIIKPAELRKQLDKTIAEK